MAATASTGLRVRAARGTVVNAAFESFTATLGFVRGIALAAFLTREDYGIIGILSVALGTLYWLKQVGIGDKYVQQAADDEESFQRAFTLELAYTGCFVIVFAVASPLAALAYDEPRLLELGLASAAILPAIALQAPLWVFYRRLEFLRQRRLMAIDPVVSLIVTVALAAAGAGYWSLLIGLGVGAYASAAAALLACPYPLKLRYDRGSLRSYAEFGWPLLVASLSGILIAQASILLVRHDLGLAAVGLATLATTFAQYATRLDAIMTQTIYPVVCSVKDRVDLLREAFQKSNRIVLMGALPAATGLLLFAPDLVDHVLGDQWRPGVGLLQAAAVAVAIDQVGYSWSAFVRAQGDTRPIAVAAVVSVGVFAACTVPLVLALGLRGLGFGMVAMSIGAFAVRSFFLARMFPAFGLWRHAARSLLPVFPAVGVVLALRAVDPGDRALADSITQLIAFVAVAVAATVALERRLLAEVRQALRAGQTPAPVGA